ncbi:MAG: trypsin-like peptidase domain-containing protein [Lachnospiraceae bacterium]|nr:trypsin-like peptidase domain-containing protein [Lachnospiraceae bacterium]
MRWNRIVILIVLGSLLTGGILFGTAATRSGTGDRRQRDIVLTNTAHTETGWSDAERWADSVVKLEVYDSRGDRITTGSGFAAMPDPVLITARHVVVNMKYMIATRDDGTTFRVDRILADDEDSDVVVCELPAEANLKPLPVERGVPKRGTKVLAVGSQFGLINLVSDGIVSGTWESGDVKRVVFTAPVSGGSSGGPLLNEAGNVIGIVTGTYEKGQNLNLAAYADVIYALNQ